MNRKLAPAAAGAAALLFGLAGLQASPETPARQETARESEGKGSTLPSPVDDGPYTRDPRADQVLQAAIKAHGGAEAISGRQTIFLKYRLTNYDYPEPEVGTLTLWFKRPGKIRQEVAYPRKKEIRVYDGRRAWVDDGKGPKLLGSLMARMMERGIQELDIPLLYLEGSLKYLNVSKDPKGRMIQRLSWRYQGYARDIMVDVATSRILVVGEFDTPAGAISRMKIFDDFRAIQGLMVAHHQETFRNNQKYSETELLEAKFDGPVDDALFRYTGPEPAPGTAGKPAKEGR